MVTVILIGAFSLNMIKKLFVCSVVVYCVQTCDLSSTDYGSCHVSMMCSVDRAKATQF